MAARKYWLYFLPILALLWAPFVLVPRQTFANPDEYIVTSTDDTGGNCDATPTSCTLRQAINSANDDGVPSEILFSEALGSSVTISLSALLPPLTEPDTTITGLLNAGNAPRVRIDGGETLTYGLSVTATADDVAINKLIFTGFQGTGAEPNGVAIYVSGAEGIRIRGNYIGNLPGQNYASAQANNIGILIADASDVTIGGTEDTDRNTISGNVNDGVRVTNSSSITLNNNFVGVVTDFADAPLFRAKPLANGGSGIQLSDTDQSQIGANNLPNVISSNDLHGILITGSSSISNTVRHNYIGTDDTGSTYGSLDFGNGGDGVRIANDASNNALFGAGLGANRLVIAGNTDYGVLLTSGASNNSVATALIGLEVDGTTALANTSGGVAVQDDASANTIGPNNVIAGNGGPGVSLALLSQAFTSVDTTTIRGNTIGLSADGTTVVANSGIGISIGDASVATTIGTAESPNVIAGNSGAAIVISGTATIDTMVAGNIIGLRKAAAADTSYTVIADNGGEGVLVQSGPSDTTISANRIAGDDDDGTDFAGIRIAGSSTATTTISLNNIGWIPDQGEPPYLARPNADGIVIDGIAGPTEILTNVVRLNDGRGVYINNSDDVVVRSNTLAGNDDTGLLIRGDSDDIAVSENTIRDNGGYAVLVDDTSQRVSLRSNRMTGNTSGAIELDGTTIYSGSGTDSDALTLPNHGIDPPPFDDGDLADPLRLRLEQNGVVRGFVYTSTNRLETTLNPASACVTCTLQIFGPAEGVSDGQPFVWLQDVPNSQFAEDGSFVAQVFGALPNQLIVIATDGFGNSSEAVVLDVDHQLVLTPVTPVSAAQDAEPGQTVTYTLSLSNPGTIDYSNLQFTTAGTYASWIPARDPATNPLTLRSGEDRLLTVTLTLPTGADPFVQVPITDTTTVTVTSSGLVTATRDLQTTVLEKPILVAAPLQDSGSAVPSETVSYGHTITNTGNVTVTVDLTYNTVDPADSQRLWATTLNTDTLTLGPGLGADVLVTVQVPPGANVEDGQGNPVQATTYLTATARGYSGVTATFSDTTRVTLEPDATMIQDETQSGEAGQVVLLYHTVTNTGNGVTNFQLSYVANRGSTVEFVSDSDGITINENNVFSLDNVLDPPARTNTMRFVARITLNRDLLPGDEETINILLRNFDTGDAIGGATVVDRITIEAGEVRPRVWFPLLQVE